MKIVFRADASLNIGSGHIMRCLTLADALSKQGHQCHFLCRPHSGHLGDLIIQRGYDLHFLTNEQTTLEPPALAPLPDHAHWLGTSWQADAQETLTYLSQHPADWLILDHYALDYRWQNACLSGYNKLMVIDDLADREHLCDLLLDQTYGRSSQEYYHLVPRHCQFFTGSEYALLRPEFHQWRTFSLKQRHQPELRNILINLGGVDKDNITGRILKALHASSLPNSCSLTVVMGPTAPHIDAVKSISTTIKHPCHILQGVNNMAELMAHADFAIGAAGSTSWERCCLGLPTLMIILANNQETIGAQLQAAGAAKTLAISNKLEQQIAHCFSQLTPENLSRISQAARTISDGQGCSKVLQFLNQG
ncbi:UDP-2,4-diacetamido-2,4,6-trideoxy-beta-L-altropyranose hydrolase [Oceanospirillum sediminis]|uniref:UDP-2,4-diacetamido-2,4, 6-trideoxy-beta-L-altropyranose hydrolase n=1 Tax=Oceanospirillum sediminis TaxID=2760088 RepID=A0A839IKA5_9GAMM|nr:UDP-2,4-diacetamido-2,4,6-trideoxy-beta-L-altropyranose hydrolase [Oceanospirillum sediminis]MBB1485615.1 UDP-2,4-diacetamido-2,4,6-trideoxy-beta-L-altropyranose hydrolase [Oceanospirillum sediminis]